MEQEHNQNRLSAPQEQNQRACKSADYSHFYENKIEPQQQITELKQKAHKSFLQVIQIQHLHQQQISQITEQYQERQKQLIEKSLQLQNKVLLLENQLKLTNKHILELSNTSFSLDNIDLIQCKDNDQSKFQENSFFQLKELLVGKQNQTTEKIRLIKKDLLKELIGNDSSNKDSEKHMKLQSIVDNIFNVMNQMNEENNKLQERIDQSNVILLSLENQFKSLKIQYQSSQKQAKFLSDHMKRVIADKNVLEKKLHDSDKNKRILQQHVKCYKRTLQDHGIHQLSTKADFDLVSCANMELSSNNSSLFHLDDLNESNQSLSMKTDNYYMGNNSQKPFKMTTQNSKPLFNPLKNFRKKKQVLD